MCTLAGLQRVIPVTRTPAQLLILYFGICLLHNFVNTVTADLTTDSVTYTTYNEYMDMCTTYYCRA
jgi:hypothetical protein